MSWVLVTATDSKFIVTNHKRLVICPIENGKINRKQVKGVPANFLDHLDQKLVR